jgi:hypothetical protein
MIRRQQEPSSWLNLADWGEEVDQVTIGVAKQHRAAAPRLVGRLQNEFANQFLEPEALCIDVFYLKIEDYRQIGSRLCRSGIASSTLPLTMESSSPRVTPR